MKIKVCIASIFLFQAYASGAMGRALSGERTIDGTMPGYAPAVASIAGKGDWIVAWEGFDEPASRGVFLRLFGADGNPKGPAFPAQESTAGEQTLPAVSADARGNFVVAWQDGPQPGGGGGGDGDGPGVFAQLFRHDGKRLGSPLRLSVYASSGQFEPDVAMDAGGSFVAAWRDGAYGFVDAYAVGRFSATGIRQGFELALGANPPPTHGTVSPPLVIEQSDGFAVGWTEYGGCFDEQPVSVVTRFTKRGEPARDRFELSDPDCGSSSWLLAALASSPTAGLSVALFNGGRNSLQLFDRDGRPLFRRRIIGNPDPCPSNLECERLAAAAMRSNGDFAVIWQRWHGDSPSGIGSEVLAQVFDRSGRALGDRFQVNEGNPHAAVKPVAALSDDGILTVVWARQSGTANVLVYRQFKLQLQAPP